MKLLEGLDTDHQIYMDNYYTSPTLFRDLKRLGFGACGTARVDRKGIPPTFRGKLPKGQVRTSTLAGGVLALQWMDKRLVTMLSTGNDSSMSTIQRRSRHSTSGLEVIQKPSVVVDYNAHMGGVDQADQMLSYYGFSHRTVKWWRRAFYHLFNVSIVNSYILYQEQGGKCSHEQFRVELARQLLSKAELNVPSPTPLVSLTPTSRLTGRHFLGKIPTSTSGRIVQSQCRVCCWRKGRKRVTTTYRCKQCEVPLCVVPCFELYHTHTNPVRYLN